MDRPCCGSSIGGVRCERTSHCPLEAVHRAPVVERSKKVPGSPFFSPGILHSPSPTATLTCVVRLPRNAPPRMKICALGIPQLVIGRHNVKDPRLDAADRLVEAKKKTYVQVDVVGEDGVAAADVFVVAPERRPDLLLQDLEFVETRLGRATSDVERSALLKLKAALEQDRTVAETVLSAEERQAMSVHAGLLTARPLVVATPEELERPELLVLRAYSAAGYISFLTVGGKENRAWMIRKGATAWEAAGVIHSDIQRGFIRAEVIRYDDLIACGGETGAKRAGKLRLEGRDYVVQDYDVMHFRFNK